MSGASEVDVYAGKEKRKRELIAQLQGTLSAFLSDAEILEKKAWDILGVASATFGIGAAIEGVLIGNTPKPFLAPGFGGILVFYIALVCEVLCVIKPVSWWYVPGTEDGTIRFETLLKKYIAPSEDVYLDKLVVDYAGKEDVDDSQKILPGAIQVAQGNNMEKARHVQRASLTLGLLVVSLVVITYLVVV